MTEIRASKRAVKDLKPISPIAKRRIRQALVKLADWPQTSADVKAMQGREGFRMRVGTYRVLFHQEHDEEMQAAYFVIDRIKLALAPYEAGMPGEVVLDRRTNQLRQVVLDLAPCRCYSDHPWSPCDEVIVNTNIIAEDLLSFNPL